MQEQFIRSKLLIGDGNFEKLNRTKVLVIGVGGVGGYVVEALARSGIGNIDLLDNDKISISNINRQIIATIDTIEEYKVDAMKKRIYQINPNCKVNTYTIFLLENNISKLDLEKYDYVVDAIDTISTKISLIERCHYLNVPIISSMGTGNKLNPSLLEIVDISKTSVCPVARVVRYELRKRGINHLKVCYSKEIPQKIILSESDSSKHQPASMIFVPSTAGILIAYEIVKDIIGKENINATN